MEGATPLAYLQSWDAVIATPGAARNPDVAAWQRGPMPGSLHLFKAHHPTHAALKRPSSIATSTGASALPAEVLPVCRPYNASGFNFTKVAPKEVVALLHADEDVADDLLSFPMRQAAVSDGVEGGDGAVAGAGRTAACGAEKGAAPALADMVGQAHPIFINASPFCRGHSLLVPFLYQGRPQVLQNDALAVGCRAARLLQGYGGPGQEGRRDARVGFNSLAAFASVNHCHMHVWWNTELWGQDTMPVERAPRQTLAKDTWAGGQNGQEQGSHVELQLSLVEWPLPCLLVQARGAPPSSRSSQAGQLTAAAVAVAGAVIEACQRDNVPHNLALWWEEEEQGRKAHALSILIVPRLAQAASLGGHLNIALLEACGLATIVTVGSAGEDGPESPAHAASRVYQSLDEAQAAAAMSSFALPQQAMDGLVQVAIGAMRDGAGRKEG